MAKVVAFANHKGGTAKTTTVMNLGVVLAEKGLKVLLIDLDPQGSLSIGFGFNPFNADEHNTYELLIDRSPARKLTKKVRENLYLIPSDMRLDDARDTIFIRTRRDDVLRDALKSVREDYDFILLDCRPSIDILTINAFSASDSVVIPMSCEFLAMAGVSQALVKIAIKGKEANPDIEVLGVLPTRFDTRVKNSFKVLEETKQSLHGRFRVFDVYIREGVRAKEAPGYAVAVTEYSPKDRTSDDYRNFAEEFLKYV